MIGERANQAAAASRFADYRSRRAEQTLRRQDADLELFREFLARFNIRTGDLAKEPGAWRPVTWGLVDAGESIGIFLFWQ